MRGASSPGWGAANLHPVAAFGNDGDRVSPGGTPVREPSAPSSASEILRQESLAFAAFNRHDLESLLGFFTEDLEFLHDQDGALGKGDVREGFRSLFRQDNGLHRELIEGAFEVHPVSGFGAIQIGRHRFRHDENGIQDCGTFGFTHVWRRTERGWRIARALSYGH